MDRKMESSHGNSVSLKNQFEALLFDNSEDPLAALNISTKNKSKNKSRKQGKNQDPFSTSKLKIEQPQAQKGHRGPLEKPVKKFDVMSKKAIDEKSIAKPTKPGQVEFDKKKATADFTKERLCASQPTLDAHRGKNNMTRRKREKYNLRQSSQWKKLSLEAEYDDDSYVYDQEFPQRAGARQKKRQPMNVTLGHSIAGCCTEETEAHVAASCSPDTSRNQRLPKIDNELEFPALK